MNRRILKKQCKRAMRILIERHGYRRDDFVAAEGDESIDAPTNMERRFVKTYLPGGNSWLHPGPLKGTPLLYEQTSYEYDEWDARLPTHILNEIEFWAGMSDEAWRPMAESETPHG